MKRSAIFLLVIGCFLTSISHATDSIGILINKKSILSFSEDIIDVDIDSEDYFFKIKGKNLLIRAKKTQASHATLFVRYGKDKTNYVAEIFADEKAPIHRVIDQQEGIEVHRDVMEPAKRNYKTHTVASSSFFAPNQKQQYSWFAVDEGGVIVMISNIMHSGKNTYIRVYIENNTTVNLQLSQQTFEYITTLKKWLFFSSEQKNRVNPIVYPSTIDLGPMQFDYFEFAIPTYTSNGGLDIFLGESEHGIRKFKINIPTKILLQAPRR